MSATDTDPPKPGLYLLDRREPALEAGDYDIAVTQQVTREDGGVVETAVASAAFSVRGGRLVLPPQEVHAVYPPDGSRGDHAVTLPHVSLERATLPWERRAAVGDAAPASPDPDDTAWENWRVGDAQATPWLCLVLVTEEDGAREGAVSLAGLQEHVSPENPKKKEEVDFPAWTDGTPAGAQLRREKGEDGSDQVMVLDLPRGRLGELLPRPDQIHLFAHVRYRLDPDDAVTERAVILAHRHPKPNARTTAHLISLEGRFGPGGFLSARPQAGFVRFVRLKSWSFFCNEASGARFEALHEALGVGTLRLDVPETQADAAHFAAQGAVALHFSGRDDEAEGILYHGPFVPWHGASTSGDYSHHREAAKPVEHAALGVRDASHAAAWELGRLMTLNNPAVARALHAWKCHCYQSACGQMLQSDDPRCAAHDLPCSPAEVAHPFPSDWFDRLARLEGVPFLYLVPDERLLPRDAIRFFEVERRWVGALLDGAFSVGSISDRECAVHDAAMRRQVLASIPAMSGFLLRSGLVSEWPDLRIDVRGEVTAQRPLCRVAPDIALCLVEGAVSEVDVSVPREALHYELSGDAAGHGSSAALGRAALAKPHSFTVKAG